MSRIILASASPRRRQLLAMMGLEFEVVPSEVDETAVTSPQPELLVRSLALAKAADVAARCPEAVVIGSDTVVCKDGLIMGKPRDAAEAVSMLKSLSGQTHRVATGIAVVGPELTVEDVVCADVTFRPLSDGEISRYVASGEPLDKAGAYGIQGLGAAMVSRVSGDYYAVVGLPVCRLCQILRDGFGIEVL